MNQTKRCAACGYDAHAEAQFCPRCGNTQFLAPMVSCRVCGAVVPGAKFCAHCGADLQNPAAQVWRNCSRCGSPIHITQQFCGNCGAAGLPPVQPKPLKKKKKRSSGAAKVVLSLLLVLMLLSGLGVWVSNGGLDQLLDMYVSTEPTAEPTTEPTRQPGKKPKPTLPPMEETTNPPVTKPAATQPAPTQPVPTQPVPTQPASNIPAEYASHYYLGFMESGYCEEMTGDIVIYFLYVNDPDSSWTEEEKAEAEEELINALSTLKSEAATYGVDLALRAAFNTVSIDVEFQKNSKGWQEEAMRQAELQAAYKDQRKLEEAFGADQVPVVFLVDEDGRSYASVREISSGFESVTILQKDYYAIRHELCHVFGARDLYFPRETVEAANLYLPNAIMNDSHGDVDALTAFAIGWLDTLTPEAKAFLDATSSLTEEYIDAAKAQDSLTGYGTKYFKDGYYVGYMREGMPDGNGIYYWDDGRWYDGNWDFGQLEGYGEYHDAEGYVYKGYFHQGKRHGTGKVQYASGNMYEGDFVEDERHGKGTYTWSTGESYTGDWVHDERSGYGVYTTPDGASYTGEWKDGHYHGKGKMIYTSGDCYEGDFAEGKRHGKGTYTWKDGSYYTGDFVEGVREGYGEYYYAGYGTRYVGQFVGGKRHGWGTYYYADGTVYEGPWENDRRAD